MPRGVHGSANDTGSIRGAHEAPGSAELPRGVDEPPQFVFHVFEETGEPTVGPCG